jgi:integrase
MTYRPWYFHLLTILGDSRQHILCNSFCGLADKIGLKKRIGWHTFRHTFGTILNANGENPKVIQELLRHANLKVTMDTYVQGVTDEKRKAQSKVVRMLLPGMQTVAF